jgi:MSHA biogenesis protein MshL
MKSLQTIQRALVLGLSMAGWGLSHATIGDEPAIGRMSLSLSLSPGAVREEAPARIVPTSPMSTSPMSSAAAAQVQLNPPAAGVIPRSEGRFDIAVRNAPAPQVFAQLAAGSNFNMLVPPDITGTITLNLKNTTLPEALDTIRELYGYDYRITGNRVFVSSNTVQTRLFRINYLPGRRVGSSELSIASAAQANTGSANAGGAGSTASTATTTSGSGGSAIATSSVRTTSDADFWKEVTDSLTSLIGKENGRSVTINPGAGVILVRATPAELRQVADYLRAVQVTIERQVMLEAKIVEVQLAKGSETGVNWGLFRSQGMNGGHLGAIGMVPGVSLTGTSLSNSNVTVTPGSGVSTTASGKGFYGLALQTPNFSALLSFLETQGNVQVLSSPRIAALNNQKAVLKVGSDDTFVTSVTNNITVINNTAVNSPTVATKTYFSGISLDVTPQIDDNGTVMLHVHPAISTATTKDLTLKLGDSGTYQVPGVAIAINETDSIVRVRDGQIVAIGGLMQQSDNANTTGVPGLGEAPVVGRLFSYRTRNNTKRELVILIKPTVLNEDGTGAPLNDPTTSLVSEPSRVN